jgi:hypothetical protein
MLTVDPQDFGVPLGPSPGAFYVLKVIQPAFGILFLAMAVSRIIDWKNTPRPSGDGNGA